MNYKKLNSRTVQKCLPKRKETAHKGECGRILMLCGSVGFTGAAALCAMGALRTGAGLVYLGVPKSIYQIEATKLTEAIVFPLPEENGMLSLSGYEKLSAYFSRVDALLIGPGLGVSQETEQLTCQLLRDFQGPVVLDADGITMMKAHKNILRDRCGPTVLTPHEGEFSRLTDMPVNDRQSCAEMLAQDLGCTVVLKGHHTIITDGYAGYINPTGNSGMAVGGSGDVLAGILAALLSQGMDPVIAAACGAWLHGAAGDICRKRIGPCGFLPTDMLCCLPRLMK